MIFGFSQCQTVFNIWYLVILWKPNNIRYSYLVRTGICHTLSRAAPGFAMKCFCFFWNTSQNKTVLLTNLWTNIAINYICDQIFSHKLIYWKTSQDIKTLARVNLIDCWGVKLFLPKDCVIFFLFFRIWIVRVRFFASFVTIWAFGLYKKFIFWLLLLFKFLSLEFYHIMSLEFCHRLSFCFLSQFKLSFVAIFVFRFCLTLSFWAL